MSEKSKLPPPSIKTSPPAPTGTTIDMAKAEAKKEQAEKQEFQAHRAERPVARVEASPVKRLAGFIIDALVILGILSLFGNLTDSKITNSIASAILWLTRDSLPFLDGQSIGKAAMKTKAVKVDGSSLSRDWKTGALRNILFITPLVGCAIEAILFLRRIHTPQAGLRLGDQWAKTKVISVKSCQSAAAKEV